MRNTLAAAAAAVSLAIAALIVVTSLSEVVTNYSPVPFADQWEPVRDWAAILKNGFSFKQLFSQHNEHRIVLARLIFYADFLFGEGRDIFNLATIAIVQALHAVLLWRLIIRAETFPTWLKLVAAGGTTMAVFSALQMENLGWGFQTQFVGVFALASLSCAALARHARATGAHPNLTMICTLIAGVATTLGMSNGVLIWPVLVVMAIMLRLPKRSLAVLIAAGAVVVGLYVANFSNPGHHANLGDSLLRFHDVIAFAAIYVGTPVGFNSIPIASVLGGLSVALTLGCFGWTLWHGADRADAPRIALLCVALFVLGSALVTGLGRLNFGLGAATVSRYMTPALVYWIALLGFVLVSLWHSHHRWGPPAQIALAGMLVIAVASLVAGQKKELGRRDHYKYFRDMASTAMWLDIDDSEIYAPLYPPDWKVPFERREILRGLQIGPFADNWDELVGRRLEDAFTLVRSGQCAGNFDQLQRVGDAGRSARVSGWAWDTWRHRPVTGVVLTDREGRIRGIAIVHEKRPDVAKAHERVEMRNSGWKGHLRLDAPGPFTAYALLADGNHACPIAETPNPT